MMNKCIILQKLQDDLDNMRIIELENMFIDSGITYSNSSRKKVKIIIKDDNANFSE